MNAIFVTLNRAWVDFLFSLLVLYGRDSHPKSHISAYFGWRNVLSAISFCRFTKIRRKVAENDGLDVNSSDPRSFSIFVFFCVVFRV